MSYIKAIKLQEKKSNVFSKIRLWWYENQPYWYRLYIKEFYYNQISARLWPNQKWLTKKIPLTWCDKTHLIEILLFECIVHFVEEEKCFDIIEWNSSEDDKKAGEEIKYLYNWIKNELPKKEKAQTDATDNWFKYSQKSGSSVHSRIKNECREPDPDYKEEEQRRLLDLAINAEIDLVKEKIDICKRICEIKEYLWI
jgi:hypothetical protein